MDYQAEYIEQFDAYVNQKMTAEERLAFEQALQSDTDLNEAFEVYKLLVLGIQANERAALKAYLIEHKPAMPQKPKWQVYSKVWAIAASIALFIGLFIVLQRAPNTPQSIALETHTTPPIIDSSSSIKNEPSPEQQSPLQKSQITEQSPLAADEAIDIPLAIESNIEQDQAGIDDAPPQALYTRSKDWFIKDSSLSVLIVSSDHIENNKHLSKKSAAPQTNQAQSPEKDALAKSEYTIPLSAERINFNVLMSEDETESYTFDYKTLNIYQNNISTYKLFKADNNWYLSIGNDVFILEYCSNNCLFVSLKDQTLKQQLLNSK
jgi:hypothetical protein